MKEFLNTILTGNTRAHVATREQTALFQDVNVAKQ